MATVQKSLRMPENLIYEIEELAKDFKKDFTAVANELLEEAIRSHRCPGIIFTEGTSGKRARIAGSGIEVWEVIATYKSVGKDLKRLAKAYDWLTDQQVKAVLSYYMQYADEIDSLISENEGWGTEKIKKKYPFLAAHGK